VQLRATNILFFIGVQVLMGGVHNLWIDPKRRPLQTAPAKKILFELKVKIKLKVLTIA